MSLGTFCRPKDRMQVGSTFRAGLVGVNNTSNSEMAGQPFHRMAPVPPHLSYKPEISTYMDHFKKPLQPPRRRQLMPPQFVMRTRGYSANANNSKLYKENYPMSDTSKFKQQTKKVKTSVKDYMDEMLKMTDNAFPAYNARVDVPCKTAQPNKSQRSDLSRIARTGFGISSNEAREITRKDRSVDFYNQHKVASTDPNPARVRSAPVQPKMSSKKETNCNEPHWMTWNSGTPEPPGLQKRLHQPWPTPEPPRIIEANRCITPASYRVKSAVARPVSGTLLPTNPCGPVPDMLGSAGIHPTLTKDREEVFTPQPPNLPVSHKIPSYVGASYPLAYFM